MEELLADLPEYRRFDIDAEQDRDRAQALERFSRLLTTKIPWTPW